MNSEFLVNSSTKVLVSLDWRLIRRHARATMTALASATVATHALAQAPTPAPVPAETAPAPAEPAAAEAPAAASTATPPPGPSAPAPAPPPATAAPAPTESQASEAAAAEPPPAEPPPAADAPKPKPPPYSLPWQLRPVVAGNVIRSDTTFAFFKTPNTDESGSTIASMLLFSYKVMEGLAPLVRVGVVSNSPPDVPAAIESKTLFLNPVVGATFAPKIHDTIKLGFFLGLALPLGTGSGDPPDLSDVAALGAGILARSAMDNAMFGVDYFTVFPGVGVAYVAHGLTLQGEVTLLQLTKTRGPDAADDSRTNFTAGFHAGYFIIPQLSLGAEIRHQRWLSTPSTMKVGGVVNDNLRDNTTFAVGPRVHIKLGETTWFRPGVAFALPLDKPMTDRDYKIVQLDLPVAF
jgi:hypothetical protein